MQAVHQQYPKPGSRKNLNVAVEVIVEWESRCCSVDPNQNAVWYDANGEKLVHYFPHVITSKKAALVIEAFQDLFKE